MKRVGEQKKSSHVMDKDSSTSATGLSSLDDFENEDLERSNASWSSNDTPLQSDISSEICDGPQIYSNPHEMRVVAMHIDWTISNETPSLFGHVVLDIEQVNPGSTHLVLDFAQLLIITVQDAATRQPLLYRETNRCLESSISIDVAESLGQSSKCSLSIMYQKSNRIGLYCNEYYENNLEDRPNGTNPLVYSEFDYFRGRNLFPCQDTPTNRVQFSATVHVDKHLHMLMSAKLVKTVQQKSTKILYFVNPHPIPVFAIGFVIGKFRTYDLDENVKIHTEGELSERYLTHLKQIPKYMRMFRQLVGEDLWGTHHIALVSKGDGLFSYPYLHIFPVTVASPDLILHSFAYNWFRSATTVRHIDDMWLNEAFPVFVARRLSALIGNMESEKRISAGAHTAKWMSNTLHFNLQHFSESNTSKMIIDKCYLCFLVLEHYGGRYGEFESFVRDYYEETKLKYVDTEVFVNLAKKHLVFRNTADDTSLSPPLDEISDVATWIENGAVTPEDFHGKITPDYDVNETLKWLLEDSHNKEVKHKNVKTKTEKQECKSPLTYLTPDHVNHRERKLVLLRKLKRYATQPSSTNNKMNQTKTRMFQVLEDRLGLNCAQDGRMKYEFVKLSIAYQIWVQLEQIKHFVRMSSEREQLIYIMQNMLQWQQASNKNMNLQDYEQTPARQEIIKLCDSRLEELLSAEEEKINKSKK